MNGVVVSGNLVSINPNPENGWGRYEVRAGLYTWSDLSEPTRYGWDSEVWITFHTALECAEWCFEHPDTMSSKGCHYSCS